MKMGITVGVAILLIIGGVAIFLSGNTEDTVHKNFIKITTEAENSEEHSMLNTENQEELQDNIINQSQNLQVDQVKEKITEDNIISNQETKTSDQPIISLIQENETISQEEIIETVIDNTVIPSDSVGLLKIPKISLSQAVLDGHSLEVLKKGLGHFDDTAYWQGNIGILGHNSGSAGYFEKLKNLVVGDSISYTTEYGTRNYEVSSITEILDTDWSMLSNTTDNRITLITCVKGVPSKRLCIQAKEIF